MADSAVTVVWAREPLPDGPAVFLAGPTPRSPDVPSWRPEAVAAIEAAWRGPGPLRVFVPENPGPFEHVDYDQQIDWETAGLDRASVILFWIPRDLRTLPGFTTNVEFGLYVRSGRVVLGCPPDCPDPGRNRYLIRTAERYGAPVCESLAAAVDTALGMIARC